MNAAKIITVQEYKLLFVLKLSTGTKFKNINTEKLEINIYSVKAKSQAGNIWVKHI